MKYIKNEALNEGYYEIDSQSGLKILVYPKPKHSSTYAIFGTKYGSIDTTFRINDGEIVSVPEGIAHYLEHKLFESEDGDAFEKYAKTGANANAYTSFDKTCYLFSAGQNVEQSLEILLDFVQQPYFTEQTVQKEQGIIGQEITMYDDDPGWRVYFNLFRAIYHNNPVRIDIAGTVESISHINAQLLYECYNSFYNLHNMVLAICGNVTPEQVLTIADKHLKKSEPIKIERIFEHEPDTVYQERIEQRLSVIVPQFMLGFKLRVDEEFCDPKKTAAMNILIELISGKTSPLYKSLMEQGLINESFMGGFESGRGYALSIFGGESERPEQVAQRIKEEIARLSREGIDAELFEGIKRKHYGDEVISFNSVGSVANNMVDDYFSGEDIFVRLKAIDEITIDYVAQMIKEGLDTEKSALSVILPVE